LHYFKIFAGNLKLIAGGLDPQRLFAPGANWYHPTLNCTWPGFVPTLIGITSVCAR